MTTVTVAATDDAVGVGFRGRACTVVPCSSWTRDRGTDPDGPTVDDNAGARR